MKNSYKTLLAGILFFGSIAVVSAFPHLLTGMETYKNDYFTFQYPTALGEPDDHYVELMGDVRDFRDLAFSPDGKADAIVLNDKTAAVTIRQPLGQDVDGMFVIDLHADDDVLRKRPFALCPDVLKKDSEGSNPIVLACENLNINGVEALLLQVSESENYPASRGYYFQRPYGNIWSFVATDADLYDDLDAMAATFKVGKYGRL